jgi:hypothetical protein
MSVRFLNHTHTLTQVLERTGSKIKIEIMSSPAGQVSVASAVKRVMFLEKGPAMKKRIEKAIEQPKPFTPGLSMAAVRQHAYEMYRDKLPNHPLTLEDWVLAEKDLVNVMHAEQTA